MFDTLWDDEEWDPANPCCSFNNPPYFCKKLNDTTHENNGDKTDEWYVFMFGKNLYLVKFAHHVFKTWIISLARHRVSEILSGQYQNIALVIYYI